MAQMTEAACLLQSGALYATRLVLQPSTGDPIFVGFKHGAFSIYFGDAPICHFDLEGRWQRAFFDGLHFLKGLDTTVQTIDRVREGASMVLERRTLDVAEAAAFDERVRASALALVEGLDDGRFERVAPPSGSRRLTDDELRAFLARVARWDADAWTTHRRTYQETYGPLPFLPPDCLQSVVLQATVGDPDGIGFGGAASDVLSIRTPREFEAHVRAVSDLLGRRVAQCRNAFLAGADALRQPERDVSANLESVGRVFALDPARGTRRRDPSPDAPHTLDGIHAFIDRFEGWRPGVETLRHWRSLGLTRVSLGVTSGDPTVRALYGRNDSNQDFREVVDHLKEAGMGVGLVVLVGAGGLENESKHVEATANLITALPLGAGDLVSLVDAAELAHPRSSWTPLDPRAVASQVDRFKGLLASWRVERQAKVAPYSLEKQGAV